MSSTVRILGSRAREQVPGTSITLLAPGFRGALTQLSAGDPTEGTGPLPLPFTAAASGANVMLAAQLAMHLQARPADDGPGLRSRSAVAGHPRLIVPKRKGVTYALLQTDETGVSSVVFDGSTESTDAVFPLTIAAQGATRRSLRVLMWATQPVVGPGALVVASRWEKLRRPNELVQLGPNGQWHPPDWLQLDRGPLLLLLHGTFGTPPSTFGPWLGDETFAAVWQRYEGRCLAFAHPTLATSPQENLAWLLENLPPRNAPIDIVAHGRGGLLARVLAADGRAGVRRICQIGTPNNGTSLVAANNLGRYVDGHVAMLARAPPALAQSTLEGALCMTRFVAAGLGADLPGLEAMRPHSPLLQFLASKPAGSQLWFTIGARFTPRSGHSVVLREPDEFSLQPNDLVVPSDGCHAPGASITDSLRLGGSDVHHHNYFANVHVRQRLAAWLN